MVLVLLAQIIQKLYKIVNYLMKTVNVLNV